MPFDSLVVNQFDAKLSYIDSGAPSMQSSYTTIFAFHGLGYTHTIFQKVLSIAVDKGIRFVAVSRRSHPGSTPFTADELDVILNGSNERKSAWMEARGHEAATFINAFIENHNLPAISDDGNSGGVAILGWSLGSYLCTTALSNADTLPVDICPRLGRYIRALILQEPVPLAFGFPMPARDWTPMTDNNIPAEDRYPLWRQWMTSYFEHGDLSKRNIDLLSYIVPSTVRVPTIFNIPKAKFDDIVYGDNAAEELRVLFNFAPQLKANYRKALFGRTTSILFPHLKISYLAGESSVSWALVSMWSVQDDEAELGSNLIDFKLIHSANHFMHWDDPEKSLEAYMECLSK